MSDQIDNSKDQTGHNDDDDTKIMCVQINKKRAQSHCWENRKFQRSRAKSLFALGVKTYNSKFRSKFCGDRLSPNEIVDIALQLCSNLIVSTMRTLRVHGNIQESSDRLVADAVSDYYYVVSRYVAMKLMAAEYNPHPFYAVLRILDVDLHSQDSPGRPSQTIIFMAKDWNGNGGVNTCHYLPISAVGIILERATDYLASQEPKQPYALVKGLFPITWKLAKALNASDIYPKDPLIPHSVNIHFANRKGEKHYLICKDG